MSQNNSFDPVAAWQDVVQKWEHEINNWSGKITQTEEFSAVMGQATKLSMVAQKAMADQMETTLRRLNLPSKSQIDALAERLDSIEESIDRLRLQIGRLTSPEGGEATATQAAPAPRRTRKPPQIAS